MILQRSKQFLLTMFKSVVRHNIGSLAAIISFFGFSAMIPLLLLLVYGTSVLLPHNAVEHFLTGVIQSYVPSIPDAKIYLGMNLARLVKLGPAVSIFGIFGLLWTTVGGFVSFQQILDVLWEAHHRRNFILQYLVGFGMLGILLVLTIVSSLTSAISPVFIKRLLPMFSWAPVLDLVHQVSHVSFPLLLFVTLYFCYRFLPSTKLPNSYLFAGAVVSTLAIYISRELFVLYTRHLGNYEVIYGSLTFIMLFTFWIYIVSMIVLIGAEVSLALYSVARQHARVVEKAS